MARLGSPEMGITHRRCQRCQSKMKQWTVVVADAGQFYEMVEPQKVLTSLGDTLVQAADRGYDTVALHKEGKRQGFLLRANAAEKPAYVSSWYWVPFKHILAVVRAVDLSTAQFGKAFWSRLPTVLRAASVFAQIRPTRQGLHDAIGLIPHQRLQNTILS